MYEEKDGEELLGGEAASAILKTITKELEVPYTPLSQKPPLE